MKLENLLATYNVKEVVCICNLCLKCIQENTFLKMGFHRFQLGSPCHYTSSKVLLVHWFVDFKTDLLMLF